MKFCFWGSISGALQGRTKGGAELQIALLARALALNGHDVVVVDPYSDTSFITNEGVKLIHVPGWNKGIRGLRLFSRRIPVLWKIFVSQKADFYYVRMRSYLHLIPYLAAQKNKSKFIVSIASDVDVFSFSKRFKFAYQKDFNLFKLLTVYIPGDMAFKYLLKRADFIFLQHSGQGNNLRRVKGKQAIFQNIFELNKTELNEPVSKDYFLYVGALTMLKGADNLLKLIDIVNDSVSFMIVGFPYGKEPKKIYEKLKTKKNVTLTGWKNQKETFELISGAKALINTSYYEGFSNTFLEAWAKGVPVLSLNINPGNVLEEYSLGICCNGGLKRMKQIIESGEIASFEKRNMIAYISEFHDFDTAADRFIQILNSSI